MQKAKILFILLTSLLIMGCKSREKEPELRDPIYLDLLQEYSKHSSKIQTLEKQVIETQKDVEMMPARSVDKKIKSKQLMALKDSIRMLKESELYFKIRAEQRKAYARRDYNIAFDKGEEWPDPKEFEAYKLNKSLNAASRNWSERVPKKSSSAERLEGMKLEE